MVARFETIYERLKTDRAPVIVAAQILEQRKSGRHLGSIVTVDWTPGEVYEIDAHAKFILRNPGYGVKVRIKGDIKNSLSRPIVL